MPADPLVVIGAGLSGLAAGLASGATVYEATGAPGGLSSSYYVRPGTTERLASAPEDGDAYRFEPGGGQWIFGGDPAVVALLEHLVPLHQYQRNAAVSMDGPRDLIPYPVQYHLAALGPVRAATIVEEVVAARRASTDRPTPATWREALATTFGPTLDELFFEPFHHRYTAGLFRELAPDDGATTPVDLAAIVAGATAPDPAPDAAQVSDDATFAYPEGGLDRLVRAFATRCDVVYEAEVVRIDLDERQLILRDGRTIRFGQVVSTLPLPRAVELTGLDLGDPDPHTSSLVVNIGAERGNRCPDEQWVYDPCSVAGFHRVGFYDNVDRSFLPASQRGIPPIADRPAREPWRAHTAVYVERAHRGGDRPDGVERDRIVAETVAELQAREWIGHTEVVDATWIEVAYTWTRPGSRWPAQAVSALAQRGVHQVGRYGRWVHQGIANSIRDGLVTGAALRSTMDVSDPGDRDDDGLG